MDDKIDRLIQKHDAQLSQHMLEINTLNHNVNIFKTVIQEIRERLGEVDALQHLHKEFNDLTIYLKGESQAIIASLDSLKKEVYQMQLKASQSKEMQVELAAKLDETIAIQDRHFQGNNLKLRDSEKAHSEKIENYHVEFQKSLEQLKNELSVSPIAIFEQNNLMMNKVENAALDGSNAMLKVNNMDMKITIVEKKMENLAIQIKKLELSNQV